MRGTRSASAVSFLPALRFALLLPVLGACGERRPPAHATSAPVPVAELVLGGGSERPLQPAGMLPMGDSSWAAVDRSGHEVWTYRVSGTDITPNRIYSLPANTPEHVLALATDRGAVLAITSAGNVLELGAHAGAEISRAHIDASHSRLLAFTALSPAAWGILEERVLVAAADNITDSLVFRKVAAGGVDTARWAIRKGHYSSMGAALADFSAATVSGHTIVIGAAVPPRLWILAVDSGRVAADTVALSGGVATLISAADRARLAASLGLRGPAADAAIPATLPTVGRVWPIGRGFLVQAAASPSESALDLYCGAAWKRRLLDGPGIMEIGMLPMYVVVVRGPAPAQPKRLQLYARSALSAECE